MQATVVFFGVAGLQLSALEAVFLCGFVETENRANNEWLFTPGPNLAKFHSMLPSAVGSKSINIRRHVLL